jgi:hypothetical protein
MPAGVTPSWRSRWLVLIAGLVSGFICWLAYWLPPPSTSDFEQIWFGARALLSGADPYAVVPATGTRFPLFYPLTAVLVGVPFAALPFPIARVLWAAGSGAAFAWAALRYGRGLPVALLSASFLNAIVQGQWSPLLTAAVVIPSLSWALGVKPSIGAALFIGFPSRWAVAGALALFGVTLIISPAWPFRWLETLPATTHMVPLLVRPGGFLLLLALIRWRLPEARLLAALGCVPQTIGLYETLPLFLIPRTRWQGYALAGSSYVAAFAQVAAVPRLPGMTLDAVLADRWPFLFVCLYLPALVMVLLPRSAEGQARSAIATESAGGT